MTNDDIARAILDAGRYVVLATAAMPDGLPWASPVWFATEDYRELFWVSYPSARHSQNIGVRPQIAMVVFDSTVPGKQRAGDLHVRYRGAGGETRPRSSTESASSRASPCASGTTTNGSSAESPARRGCGCTGRG